MIPSSVCLEVNQTAASSFRVGIYAVVDLETRYEFYITKYYIAWSEHTDINHNVWKEQTTLVVKSTKS